MTEKYETVVCLGGPEDGRIVRIEKSQRVVQFPAPVEAVAIAGSPEPQNCTIPESVYRKTTLRSGETVLVHAS